MSHLFGFTPEYIDQMLYPVWARYRQFADQFTRDGDE